MHYRDLREFIQQLESDGELKRISQRVDPYLEITEIADRTLRKQGPALLFEQVGESNIPLLANLFGTPERVARAMGEKQVESLREIGKLLAFLKEPEPPKGFIDAIKTLPIYKKILDMSPRVVKRPLCQQIKTADDAVDLSTLPIQTCWPDDAGPLITWGLVTTRGPSKPRQNLGIYRQQVIAKNKLIMRWLPQRGGALDYKEWCEQKGDQPFPISVVLGCDPATILAAVTPIPDTLSEYAFAGLLRGGKTEVAKSILSDLQVPARAEIILEGFIYAGDEADEGPFGDHTGYYNEVERFPVFTVEAITSRKDPIYLSTYTGRPPDEPSVLGLALNEVFIPILQKQFPEIVDFYLPPEGCSYRVAIVSMKKSTISGLLRGGKTEVAKSILSDLQVPARAEIILEGFIYAGDEADEGPFGDHTGYYNEVERFPVFTVEAITSRKDPIYLSTYTGRPPDEPSVLGLALNEVFIPILQKQFPEIVDFYLPPEGCSYRVAIVSMKKQYPGHAKRVMMGVWSYLRQFMYTKFVIVVDDDIDARNWEDVIWAISTRVDPARDLTLIENTPIDYLDFASPVSGLGSKMGLDATNKIGAETSREWGKPITMDAQVIKKIDDIWQALGIDS